VRRLGFLAGLAALTFAPAAHAAGPCGVTATPVRGSAPLTVTFTATCNSAVYTWDFGDGAQGFGPSVQHVYGAGAWYPKLTTDLGAEPAATVTAITVSLTGPRTARYAQWVTLRATVTPRVPVTLHGRRFVHGKLRVRVLGTAPWIASALGTRSPPVTILVTPRLVVRTAGNAIVGGHVRVVASLHPAAAGRIDVPEVDTRTAHVAHLTVRSRPAKGWTGVSKTLSLSIVQPDLSLGARGPSVLVLEQRLRELHYAVQVDGVFGEDDVEAVYAFQKVLGLARTGQVDGSLWRRPVSQPHATAAITSRSTRHARCCSSFATARWCWSSPRRPARQAIRRSVSGTSTGR
jgi:hypothetical protein